MRPQRPQASTLWPAQDGLRPMVRNINMPFGTNSPEHWKPWVAQLAERKVLNLVVPGAPQWVFTFVAKSGWETKATPVGFEPTRGDPIGLAGRRLNRSAKVSLDVDAHCLHRQTKGSPACGTTL